MRILKQLFAGAVVLLATVQVGAQTPAASVPVQVKAQQALAQITTTKPSVLQKRLHREKKLVKNPMGILFYEPNYIMPLYYTGSADNAAYEGDTPDDQAVKNLEFKFQFSFQLPVWQNIFKKNVSLFASYTQLSYWQVYAHSQWFRETNYEPQLFFVSNFQENWLWRLGVDHQSNGRGGNFERSWNRVFATVTLSRGHWMFMMQPWVLIFKSVSSNLHNPDIADYLGHERFVIAYEFKNHVEVSLMIRNLERLTSNVTEELDLSVPISKHIDGFIQVFNGYGQSLIEYNHRTTSVGLGISLSNWL
jgi:phospholipase A1